MATRDRWGTYPSEPATTQLQRYIQNACDPSNFEPNLALNLEISDLINQKKGNAPREAAVAIVGHINNRNPNVSLLALALLDICVKNCGYAFHLQISTKEFLNELVRRFPERPPIRVTKVQMKILEAIEEWRSTICMTSRYKEDMGFIRDMHRLLSFKGYLFPEVRREDAAVLNPSDNLKSAEELEEEERSAQSAKLQELIRRGTPSDLQEANHLMKIMAGYDQTNKTDYRQKAAEDIAKLQEKQKILDDMLARVKKGDTIGQQDAFEELSDALRNAQPKLHKMAEEESDDTDAVVRLFALNDSINVTVEKYKLLKKGDFEAASTLKQVPVPEIGGPSTETSAANDLIDLMGDEIPPSNGTSDAAAGKQPTTLEDDLLGLSFQDQTYGAGGGIALGFGAHQSIPGPPLLSSTLASSSARQATPEISSPPNYTPFSTVTTPPAKDSSTAFAGLAQFTAPSPRPASFQFSSPSPQPTAQQHNRNDDDDDFAAFSSAVPPSQQQLPALKANEVRILASQLRIVLEFMQRTAVHPDGPIVLRAKFSNASGESIKDITFQLAVTKSFQLKMEHQSNTTLSPNQQDGITQIIRVSGVAPEAGGNLRMRWKVTYRVGNSSQLQEEAGDASSLPVS